MMKTWSRVPFHTFLTLITVVHSDDIYVRVGDMIALNCRNIRINNTEIPPSWTSFTPRKRDLSDNIMNLTSPFLIHNRSLILLNASMEHQGNYSCSVGDHTFWSKLIVYPAVSDEIQKRVRYTSSCFAHRRCTLHCPMSNSPPSTLPNMTSHDITWKKDGRELSRDGPYFSSVKETDQGAFTCTRSYLYKSQIYNMTFTVTLTVKPQEPLQKVEIISPHDGDVFQVDLGSDFVINCTASISSDFDDVYWIIDKSYVKSDPKIRVSTNYTSVTNAKNTHMTASLIFKKVLAEDLLKNFTCKLESVSVASSFVIVSLKQKKQERCFFPTVIIVAIILASAVTALICVKFKVNIYLCLCNGLCTKSVDAKPSASLVCYQSESEMAMKEDDIKWLENVLDNELGYKLCHHCNSLSVEKPVMDSIEQSHAVILVPVWSDSDPDSSLIAKDCLSMDKSNTCIILIQTDSGKESKSSSELNLHEASPFMKHTEQRIVTWRGTISKNPSSSFIKHLRYHLPPPQHSQDQHVSEVKCI